jgi:hypothetical protein
MKLLILQVLQGFLLCPKLLQLILRHRLHRRHRQIHGLDIVLIELLLQDYLVMDLLVEHYQYRQILQFVIAKKYYHQILILRLFHLR